MASRICKRLCPFGARFRYYNDLSPDPVARARDRMSKPKSFFKALTETGPLIALGTALAILVSVAGPASAQFFNFPGFGGPPQRSAPPPQRGGGGGGWFGGDFFAPFQQQQPQAPRQDFSRAPAPAKRETIPDRNVLVIGDAMADWLAYGLEDAYTEHPDMGVIRLFLFF